MKKKLKINRESVRLLTTQLRSVAGGDISDVIGGCTSGTTGNSTEDCPPSSARTFYNCHVTGICQPF